MTLGLEDLLQYALYAAIAALVALILKALLVSPSSQKRPYAPPKPQKRLFLQRAELGQYDGRVAGKPTLVGIRGKLYDVSGNSNSYGPGAGYNVLTGRDASVALAKMDLSGDKSRDGDSLEGLTADQLQCLEGWEATFATKYVVAGEIVDSAEQQQQKQAEEEASFDQQMQAYETELRQLKLKQK